MRNFLLTFVTLIALLLIVPAALAQDSEPVAVPATAETTPSPADGATSAAIWLHPSDPTLSVVLGTDDNAGVGVYALDGSLLSFAEIGDAVNLDLRYNFPLGDAYVDLIAVGEDDAPLVHFLTMDADTRELVTLGQFETGIPHGGLCLYRSPLTETFYLFQTSGDGEVEQYALDGSSGQITGTLLRQMSVGGEVETCVADDELRAVYFSEEDVALWRYGAEPEAGVIRRIVDLLEPRGFISEQIEGLTLIYGPDRSGYLIGANESNDSFLVYERGGRNAFVGQFTLEAVDAIDRVNEPNGMDVLGVPLGETYPAGLFVTGDDRNSNPNEDTNFKYASWADVATALGLDAAPGPDPRSIGAPGMTDAAPDTSLAGEVTVPAAVETVPVESGTDAADDPAIWLHPTDPALSTLIGTDKTSGLYVYNLDGSIHQELLVGRVNNVDIRYNVMLDGTPTALVTTTNRSDNSLMVFAVDPDTRELRDVAAGPIPSAVSEVYGLCMYQSALDGTTYAILNSAATGDVEQYALIPDGSVIQAELVRSFSVGSQTEGCVADDLNAALYIGEEGVGIWKYGAEPDASPDERVQVDRTVAEGGQITPDVEGLALYQTANGGGYLIASSQGSSEFLVYERGGENAYIGKFIVIQGDGVDAVSGTDGIDVTNAPLGDAFPNGAFVAQDDRNIDPDGNQNFKLVDWALIAEGLGLEIDTTFDPR